jgi:hypothetical protein
MHPSEGQLPALAPVRLLTLRFSSNGRSGTAYQLNTALSGGVEKASNLPRLWEK